MKNRQWQKNVIGYDYTISCSGDGDHLKIWLITIKTPPREYHA
jgi:hypothetical protein